MSPRARAADDQSHRRAPTLTVLPLGEEQESRYPPEPDHPPIRDLQRMRDALRTITTRSASKCGYMIKHRRPGERVGAPSADHAEIRVREQDGQRRAQVRGPVRCKSPHSCPECASSRRSEASRQITHATSHWREAGGELGLLTLTIRHHRNDDLRLLVTVLLRAWHLLTHGSPWLRIAARLGIAHTVRGFDVTHGPRGWHPHLHVLLFVVSERRDEEAAALARARLSERWASCLTRALVENGVAMKDIAAYLPDEAHGTHLKPCARGEYLVKLGLSSDAARDFRDSGGPDGACDGEVAHGRRNPWQIAASAALGDARDRVLWQEYTHAILRVRLVTGLAGLRRAFGDAPVTPEAAGTEELVAVIPRPVYMALAKRLGAMAHLLEAAERGGLLGVAAAAAEVFTGRTWEPCPGDPSPTPPPAVSLLLDLFDPRFLPGRLPPPMDPVLAP